MVCDGRQTPKSITGNVEAISLSLADCPLLGFLHYFLGLLLILSLGLLRIF
jgi:hypothetical protein